MKAFALFLLIVIYSCADETPVNKSTTNGNYENAWNYLDKNDNINAFIEFGRAKDVFNKNKDELGVGKCLMNMAIIQEKMGDDFGSQETGVNALSYFKENNIEHKDYLSANYNSLGIVNNKLKNYDKAIVFLDKAIEISINFNDINIYLNNKASTFQEIKKYNEAIKIYNQILDKTVKNNIEYARVLTNLAKTKWLQNPNYNPIPEFNEALNIRLKEKDNWGLNSSYAHLADYYSKNNQDSALFFAKKMYETASEINSPDDKIEALQKLISLENPENSIRYFKAYQNINDSLQTARSKAKNQFALIRYETEKNKADFLKAQAESAQRQNHIIKQYIALAFAFLIIVAFITYLKKRQKIHQQEKLLEVQNTELKYSKKVHDRVANRIYQILSQVENKAHIDRDSLLFGLENVYETSRDISYENEEITENKNYFEQLQNMFDSYSSDAVKIIYFGNNEALWEGVNFQIKTDVYLILQELMTNMKKHSRADKVFIKFAKEKTNVSISYTDNGIGLGSHQQKNGLQNMVNRIQAINGIINFDTETKNLLKINISLPI